MPASLTDRLRQHADANRADDFPRKPGHVATLMYLSGQDAADLLEMAGAARAVLADSLGGQVQTLPRERLVQADTLDRLRAAVAKAGG